MRTLKFVKLLIGVALLPACGGITAAVLGLVAGIQPLSPATLPPEALGFLIGFFFWIFLFFTFPRPMRTYFLAHELTHALWAWLHGARVSHLRVNPRGGSVRVSRDNILISLAPYFFPLYTIIVIAAYAAASRFYDQTTYRPFWMGLVGLTWAFHLTFTIDMLRHRQPDIIAHGRLFSYTVIYILNLFGIGLWIVAVAAPGPADFALLLRDHLAAAYQTAADVATALTDAIVAGLQTLRS